MNTLSDTLSSGLINVISDVFTFLITLVTALSGIFSNSLPSQQIQYTIAE